MGRSANCDIRLDDIAIGVEGIRLSMVGDLWIAFTTKSRHPQARRNGRTQMLQKAACEGVLQASLYFMLTNHAPLPSQKRYDLWDNMFRNDALPIRQRVPKIPARLAEVIDAALVEEPRIGFQTAAEFKREIERVL